jgi:Na+/proline symporter
MILSGVAATVLAVVVIGLYASRKVRGDSENFIVAGRGLILPLAAATLMAQAVDTNATLGNTDLTSEFGFWAGASLPIGLALCLFITGLFFAKPLNRMRLTTLPDFYRRRYGRVVEVVSALIMVLSFSILLAGNLVAGGYLFQTFLGTSYAAGVLLIVAIVLIYTIAGGLFSVAYTDVIQVVIAFAGAVALIGYVSGVYGITIPDGMGPFAFEQLSDPEFGAYINWATLAALGLGDIVAIDFMQRVFASRNPQTARRACLLGSLGTLAVGVPFALIALSASDILKTAGVQADGPVLYALLQDVVPAPLAVLVLSGIVAAGLSTADGAVLGTSAVSARNILGLRDEGGQAHYEAEGQRDRLLLVTRLFALPIAALAVFFALRVPETGILLTLAFDIGFAGLLIPLVLGLWWSRANAPAALACIVAGSLTRLVLFVLTPTTFGVENTLLYIQNGVFTAGFDGLPTFISPLVGLAVFAAVALLTGKKHPPTPLDEEGRRLEERKAGESEKAGAPAG